MANVKGRKKKNKTKKQKEGRSLILIFFFNSKNIKMDPQRFKYRKIYHRIMACTGYSIRYF